jgi:hypothetical protein
MKIEFNLQIPIEQQLIRKTFDVPKYVGDRWKKVAKKIQLKGKLKSMKENELFILVANQLYEQWCEGKEHE